MPVRIETRDCYDELATTVGYGTSSCFRISKTRYGPYGPTLVQDRDYEPSSFEPTNLKEKIQAICIANEIAKQLEHCYPEGSPVEVGDRSQVPTGTYHFMPTGQIVWNVQRVERGEPFVGEPYEFRRESPSQTRPPDVLTEDERFIRQYNRILRGQLRVEVTRPQTIGLDVTRPEHAPLDVTPPGPPSRENNYLTRDARRAEMEAMHLSDWHNEWFSYQPPAVDDEF